MPGYDLPLGLATFETYRYFILPTPHAILFLVYIYNFHPLPSDITLS